MSVRVAVIGAGVMESDHARILAEDLPGAHLQVVCDASTDRARSVADALGASDAATDAMATLMRSDVDAALIASPDETHAPLSIATIQASKPILCEKPLAPTSKECLEAIATEVNTGRRLVQTGFKRRSCEGAASFKAEGRMVSEAYMLAADTSGATVHAKSKRTDSQFEKAEVDVREEDSMFCRIIDQGALPSRFPTHRHQGEFW